MSLSALSLDGEGNTPLAARRRDALLGRLPAHPGAPQALSYRTGFAKIRELREKARAALGEAFDIRDFHEAMLGSGAMPLGVLESHIDWFIEQKRSATSPRS